MMKYTRKRLLSLTLALVMLLGIMVPGVSAESTLAFNFQVLDEEYNPVETVNAGDAFYVQLNFSGNAKEHNPDDIQMFVVYDSELVTVEDMYGGTYLASATCNPTIETGVAFFGWASAAGIVKGRNPVEADTLAEMYCIANKDLSATELASFGLYQDTRYPNGQETLFKVKSKGKDVQFAAEMLELPIIVEGTYAVTSDVLSVAAPYTGNEAYANFSVVPEAAGTITWAVEPADKGVSIDTAGKMTVTPAAVAGTYTVKALEGENVVGSKTIEVTKEASKLTSITIKKGSEVVGDTDTLASAQDNNSVYAYTAVGVDQYGVEVDVTERATWSAGEYAVDAGEVTIPANSDKAFELSVTMDGQNDTVAVTVVKLVVNAKVTIHEDKLVYGNKLGDMVTIASGSATLGTALEGDFSLVADDTVPNAGEVEYQVVWNSKDGKYTNVPAASGEIVVAKKNVTITGLSANNKDYDGNATATATGSAVVEGLIVGDDVTVKAGTAAFDSAAAGSDKTVTFTGYALEGEDADNYNLSVQPAQVTASIAKKDVAELTWGPDSQVVVYGDGTIVEPTAEWAGEAVEDFVTITYTYDGTDYATAADLKEALGALKADDIVDNQLTFTAKIAAKADTNYEGSKALTINVEMVDIKFDIPEGAIVTKEKPVYGDSYGTIVESINSIGAYVGENVFDPETADETEGFYVKNADTVPNAGSATIEIWFKGEIGSKDYDTKVTEVTVDVDEKDVTISGLSAENKQYDGNANATPVGTPVIVGKVGDDDVAVVAGSAKFITDGTEDSSVGNDKNVVFSGYSLTGEDAKNYNLIAQPDNTTADITKKALTVSGLTAAGKTYDNTTEVEFSDAELDGYVEGEDVAIDAITGAFVDKNAGENKAVKVTSITLRGEQKDNYTVQLPTGLTATITADALETSMASGSYTKVYDAVAPTVEAVAAKLTVSANNETVAGSWDLADGAKMPVNVPGAAVNMVFTPSDDNYSGAITKAVAVTIAKADALIEEVEIKEAKKTLNDALIVTTLGEATENVPTVAWFDKDMKPVEPTTEIEANAEYTYSVTFGENGNYNDAGNTFVPYKVSTGVESNASLAAGATKHGSVKISPVAPEKGDKVVITVKPAAGYEVDEVTVLNGKKEVAVKAAGNNKFVFVMPAGTVKIDVTYKKANVVKFLDVADNAWYADSVYAAVDMGLFTGVSDNYFQPDGSMTRAMLVTVLWRLEGSPAAGSSDFADVANGSWYDKAVAWANEEGIVTGISDASFAPNAAITREQMATMLYRYAKYLGLNTAAKADLSDYADADKISAYAVDAMAWAVRAGLINGVTADTLAPAGTATRAQVATILVRFVEKFL